MSGLKDKILVHAIRVNYAMPILVSFNDISETKKNALEGYVRD